MSVLLPTPWEAVGNRSVRCAFEAGNGHKPGFEVATVPMFLPSDEAARVARLIAAAPELLAVSKLLTEWAESQAFITSSYCEFCEQSAPKDEDGLPVAEVQHNHDCPLAVARAVLAKAGEPA